MSNSKIFFVAILGIAMLISAPAWSQIENSNGVDPNVDYQSLTEYGPWDDRNYQITKDDLAVLPSPENEQYLKNIPAFFKIEYRKEHPNIGYFYPRALLQMFQIRHGGLLQNGVWRKDGLGKGYHYGSEKPGKPIENPADYQMKGAAGIGTEVALEYLVNGNESTIEFNPADNMQGIAGSNGSGGQRMYYTTDGGATWTLSQINPSSCCDPTVDWHMGGEWAVQADLSSSIGVRAFYTTDGGQSWSSPIVITPSGSDKEFIHVDKSPTSPHEGNVYITYHNGNVMQFVRSTNHDDTLEGARGGTPSYDTPISFPGQPTGIGSDITTDTAGTIFYFYPTLNQSPNHIRLLRSTDGGATFDGGTEVADLEGTFDFAIPAMETRRVFIYTSADVDMNNDHIYVAWTDETDTEAGLARIQVAKSTDGGDTWTQLPIPHNTVDGSDRFHPWLKVGENGVVHIVFYDTQHSVNDTGTDFYYTYSTDGGASWETPIRMTNETSENMQNGQEWGDYNGISVVLDRLAATWTDNRPSNQPGSGSDDHTSMTSYGENPAGEPTFTMAVSPLSMNLCTADTNVSVDITLSEIQGYTNSVTLSEPSALAGLINQSFGTNPLTPPNSTTYDFDVSGAATPGDYTLTIQGEGAPMPARGGNIIRTGEVAINISDTAAGAPLLQTPADGAINAALAPTLTWTAGSQVVEYVIEIAEDAGFNNIVQTANVASDQTSYNASSLDSNTTYYWRIIAANGCGDGTSAVFSFTTQPLPGDCPAGEYQVKVQGSTFGFETGAQGWTTGGTQSTWAISSANPHSGNWHWHADDIDTESDQQLTSPVVYLDPEFAPYTLQFWNYQELEDNGDGSICWDGGILEKSIDGGAFNQILDPDLATDPYDATIDDGFDNPLAGLDAWCGDPQPYLKSVVDINANTGSDIQFRFRLGTDRTVDHPGWDIDDVSIVGCGPDALFDDDFGTE